MTWRSTAGAMVWLASACNAQPPELDASAPRDAAHDCYLSHDGYHAPDPVCTVDAPGHIDCFGGFACSDGVLCEYPFMPIATGCPSVGPPVCPCSVVACLCELGCRDGASESRSGDPHALCIENRPRRAGDPCRRPGDCAPSEEVLDGDGGRRTPTLACDAVTSTCVDVTR